MLIKSADDQSAHLAQLERTVALGKGPEAKRAADELRNRKAGLKGEAESAYLIDFHFAKARNWAVIHDLRLEHGGRVAQIDHILINRLLEIYVIETKHFHAGLKITEDGEFLRWNSFRKTFEGMASPMAQNDRHIAVLGDVVADLDLPERMGVRLVPSLASLVLVGPNARVDRPKRFDTSRVIKADHLKTFIEKDFEGVGLLKIAKIVSSETVEELARQLVARHRPLERVTPAPAPDAAKPPAPAVASSVEADGPACKSCQGVAGEILYGRYGYYFQCDGCDTNTSIRFTCLPGHAPRLRKDGLSFYRECAECGSSALFHRNAASA